MDTQMKAIRVMRGYSQKEVADMLDVKVRTYGSWERGECVPGLDTAVAIADVLDCSLDDLAGRSDIAKRFGGSDD